MEYNTNFTFPNITILPLKQDNNVVGWEINPDAGYTLTLPNTSKFYDENGNLMPKEYFSTYIVGLDYDFSTFPYIAIPRSQMKY